MYPTPKAKKKLKFEIVALGIKYQKLSSKLIFVQKSSHPFKNINTSGQIYNGTYKNILLQQTFFTELQAQY